MKRRIQVDAAEAIRTSIEEGVIRVTVRGTIKGALGDRVIAQAQQLAEQSGAQRILYDFRSATLTGGVVNLIRRVRQIDQIEPLRTARTAMICNVRTNDYAFLEATANQHGQDLKVFTDPLAAIQWVKHTAPPEV
jgi:hypothetical protein